MTNKQLDPKNKQEVIDFLNSEFSGIKVEDLSDILEDGIDNSVDFGERQSMELLLDSLNDVGSFRLDGDPIDGDDSFLRLQEVFENLHYDNGLPLSGLNYPEQNPTKENNFFDHYDRDQDFGSFFDEFPVKEFKFDRKGDLYIVLDVTYKKLFEYCKSMYEGSSWEHDFQY